MLDCFMPVWGLVILLPSQICEFLFHLFIRYFFFKCCLGHQEGGDPSHSGFFAVLAVRVGEGAGEQDTGYSPRKGG